MTQADLVTPDFGPRPAGQPNRCFYCDQAVGTPHGDACVLLHLARLDRDAVPSGSWDSDPAAGLRTNVQWHNTNLCVDIACPCGASGHYDGEDFGSFRCVQCGTRYEIGHTLMVRTVGKDEADPPGMLTFDPGN